MYPYANYTVWQQVSVERVRVGDIKDVTDAPPLPPQWEGAEVQGLQFPLHSVARVGVTGEYYLYVSPNERYFQVLYALRQYSADTEIEAQVFEFPDPSRGYEVLSSLVPLADVEEYERKMALTPGDLAGATATTTEAFSVQGFQIRKSGVQAFLEDHLKGDPTKFSKVPLLLGHTGIGKSAVVKAALESASPSTPWGLRLVDMRIGFSDKLDFLGLVEVNPDGTSFSAASLLQLTTASDEFLDRVRKLVTEWSNRKDLSASEKRTLEKLRHYAKTPVLFFDEINRAQDHIINIFMVVLSNRRFANYSLRQAHMLAAANYNPASDNDAILYLTSEFGDIAKLDRFTPIMVDESEATVQQSVHRFLTSKYPELKDIVTQIWAKGWLYNSAPNAVDEQGKFPTFRGWDLALQYLQSRRDKRWVVNVVKGLVGAAGAEFLQSLLDKLGWTAVTGESMDEYIDHCLQGGVPVLLTGAAGVGKSVRLMQAAERMGAELYTVQLSAMDAASIRGYPSKKRTVEWLFPGEENRLTMALDEALGETQVQWSSAYVQDYNFARIVEKCREQGRPLVVFADELNRCPPVVQGGVFDIFDGKFLGVDLSGVDFRLVAAGNVGEGYETEDFDSATLARFSVYRKDKVDEKDVEGLIQYAKRKHWHPAVVEWLEEHRSEIPQLLDAMAVEQLDLASGTTTLRSFETLSTYLQEVDRYPVFHSAGVRNKLQSDPLGLLRSLLKHHDKLFAFSPTHELERVELPDGSFHERITMAELGELLSEQVDKITKEDARQILALLQQVEQAVAPVFLSNVFRKTGFGDSQVYSQMVQTVVESQAEKLVTLKLAPCEDFDTWLNETWFEYSAQGKGWTDVLWKLKADWETMCAPEPVPREVAEKFVSFVTGQDAQFSPVRHTSMVYTALGLTVEMPSYRVSGVEVGGYKSESPVVIGPVGTGLVEGEPVEGRRERWFVVLRGVDIDDREKTVKLGFWTPEDLYDTATPDLLKPGTGDKVVFIVTSQHVQGDDVVWTIESVAIDPTVGEPVTFTVVLPRDWFKDKDNISEVKDIDDLIVVPTGEHAGELDLDKLAGLYGHMKREGVWQKHTFFITRRMIKLMKRNIMRYLP